MNTILLNIFKLDIFSIVISHAYILSVSSKMNTRGYEVLHAFFRLVYHEERNVCATSNSGKKLEARCHRTTRCSPPPTWRIRLIAEKSTTSTSYHRLDPDHLSAAIRTRCASPVVSSMKAEESGIEGIRPVIFSLSLSLSYLGTTMSITMSWLSGISFVSKFVERRRKYILFRERPEEKLENVSSLEENDNWNFIIVLFRVRENNPHSSIEIR